MCSIRRAFVKITYVSFKFVYSLSFYKCHCKKKQVLIDLVLKWYIFVPV